MVAWFWSVPPRDIIEPRTPCVSEDTDLHVLSTPSRRERALKTLHDRCYFALLDWQPACVVVHRSAEFSFGEGSRRKGGCSEWRSVHGDQCGGWRVSALQETAPGAALRREAVFPCYWDSDPRR